MMKGLPETYFISVFFCTALVSYATLRFRSSWAMPYNAVLCTIAGWYFLEPWYFEDFFLYFKYEYIQTAYDAVLIFLIFFAILTPHLVRLAIPKRRNSNSSGAYIPPERILLIVAGVWGVLLTYGTVRMRGDLFSALFPLDARAGVAMWSRDAGAGAGSEGAIVSAASYLYMLCLSSFGLLLFILPAGRYRALALILIIFSWPYAFLQGSRSIALAVVLPTIISYLNFSRSSRVVKLIWMALAGALLELAFKIIILYRNVGFRTVDLNDLESDSASRPEYGIRIDLLRSVCIRGNAPT